MKTFKVFNLKWATASLFNYFFYLYPFKYNKQKLANIIDIFLSFELSFTDFLVKYQNVYWKTSKRKLIGHNNINNISIKLVVNSKRRIKHLVNMLEP